MKKNLLLSSFFLAAILSLPSLSFSQWYNKDSSFNAGGMVSDWMQQAINLDSGYYSTIGSTGGFLQFGVFEHYGQSGVGDSAAFINNGTYDASVHGIDYFYGPSGQSGQQAIAGKIAPQFGELYFNNGASSEINILNLQGISVTKALYFNNGLTTTIRANGSTGAVRFMTGAFHSGTIINSASGDSRYVNGYVSSIGNSNFLFPVGQNGIQALLVDGVPPTTQIAVAYFTGDASLTPDPTDGNAVHSRSSFNAPLCAVSPFGFWDWIQTDNNTGSVTVSVKIPDETGFAAAANLRLVGWNGNAWINLSGNTGCAGAARFNTLSGVVDLRAGITAIAVGAVVNVSLPVSLVSFTGVADKNCAAHLNWVTAHEQAIRSYNIELSTAGQDFITIGKVMPKNSASGAVYAFTYRALQEVGLMRLKIEERDGKYTYSQTITLVPKCDANELAILPNPAVNTIRLYGLKGEKNTVFVYNSSGAQMLKMISSSTTQALNISHFPIGNYVIKVVKADGQWESIKFQKQ